MRGSDSASARAWTQLGLELGSNTKRPPLARIVFPPLQNFKNLLLSLDFHFDEEDLVGVYLKHLRILFSVVSNCNPVKWNLVSQSN